MERYTGYDGGYYPWLAAPGADDDEGGSLLDDASQPLPGASTSSARGQRPELARCAWILMVLSFGPLRPLFIGIGWGCGCVGTSACVSYKLCPGVPEAAAQRVLKLAGAGGAPQQQQQQPGAGAESFA